ncbi:pantothenate kinase [Moniliophthora roreri]|nr:pantothenate kinase [Moniliophthora roreri]
MKSTHSCMLSVSKRSKLSDPPGKCWDVRRSIESRTRSLPISVKLDVDGDASSTKGVKAPLRLICEPEGEPLTDPLEGDEDRESRSLGVLDPLVAAIEGEGDEEKMGKAIYPPTIPGLKTNT